MAYATVEKLYHFHASSRNPSSSNLRISLKRRSTAAGHGRLPRVK